MFLKEKPLLAYYEEVLLEGLKLAAADAERGLLDPERTLLIRDAVADIVDDLSDHKDSPELAGRSDRRGANRRGSRSCRPKRRANWRGRGEPASRCCAFQVSALSTRPWR